MPPTYKAVSHVESYVELADVEVPNAALDALVERTLALIRKDTVRESEVLSQSEESLDCVQAVSLDMTSDRLEERLDELERQAREASFGSEMAWERLHAARAMRSEILELGFGLIESTNEATDKVARNLR